MTTPRFFVNLLTTPYPGTAQNKNITCTGFLLIIFTSLFVISARPLAAQDTTQKIVPGRVNSAEQIKKPYVILISVDGFRYDYARQHGAVNLLRLAKGGVTGEGIRPGFPSLTFPNHYSLVTGLYPSHHGLVDNFFYDRNRQQLYNKNYRGIVQDSSWYFGRPIWVLAEQQQMLSATFYWVGSEAAIMGKKPTYNYNFSTFIDNDRRIQIVKDWLSLPEEKRPHMICLYFYEVDNAGHAYGPESVELGVAVRKMDTVIGKLSEAVAETGLPVNFIVLSDHGMETVDNENPLGLPPEVDTTKFIVPRGDAFLQLYARDKSYIKTTYKSLRANANGFRVYLRDELPPRWEFGTRDDRYNRIGDIILIPQDGLVFNITNLGTDRGKHGFDPFRKSMMAGFFAWGPAFKPGITIKPFDNVHVYPMVARILGLRYSEKIDGKLSVLAPILK